MHLRLVMLVMLGHIEGHLNYMLSMHNTSYSEVNIIPFLIQNGIEVESIFRGMKLHCLCFLYVHLYTSDMCTAYEVLY